MPYKTKQFFWFVIKLTIVVGCGYFIYQRLLKNDNLTINIFYQNLIKNDIFKPKNVLFLLLLTSFNWFLEITKWSSLATHIRKTAFLEATKQSLASLATSLITPNRIGEYGAKAMYFPTKNRKTVMGLNIVGNFYQMLATLFFGLIGFGYFIGKFNVEIDYYRVFKITFLGLILVFSFFLGAKNFNYRGYGAEKVRKFMNKIPQKLNIQVSLLSFLRYIVFAHQLYVLLLIFKIDISYIDALSAIASVYFIASIIPMLSLFDVVLKSTVAVWIFSYITNDIVSILSVTTLMWILNFVVPAIIGCYFVLTFKPLLSK